MFPDDLSEKFQISTLPTEELKAFLSWGNCESADGIYVYGGAVQVSYNQKHEIKKIRGNKDSALVKELIQNYEEAVKNIGTCIAAEIAYSSVPLDGYFRYKEIFQILPLPEQEYKSHFQSYPFIVQFSYHKSKNIGVDNFRRNKKFFEVLYLLSSLLKYGIYSDSRQGKQRWGIVIPSEESRLEVPQTQYLQLGYFPKHLDKIIKNSDGFFSPEDLPEISRVQPEDYYQLYLDKMTIVSNFDSLLDHYYALSAEDKELYLRAAFWFTKSSEFFDTSLSAAYLCLITSIETLMNNPKPQNTTCQKEGCSEKISIGIGPTKAFKDFVEKHASGIPPSLRDRLYGIRSGIVHGSKLLSPDNGSIGIFESQSNQEMSDLRLLKNIVPLCFYNWLQEKGKTKNP